MKHIKECLDNFLEAEEAGVVAIKGDWGAGKTYFIKKYLMERQQLHEKLVSFVSLFGLSSIEEVRRQVIPSAISAKALREGKAKSHIQKLIGLGRKLPKIVDFEQLFQAVEDQLTRDLLVVFDDVERKEKELSLKSFLGYVNFLSEHAGCKVIVILNEDQLSKVDTDELSRFREKLLDREILFAPTFEENARLFFHDPILFDHALNVFRRCECRNLRIIKRCYQNSTVFGKRFENLGAESKMSLLQQVVLMSCLFYQHGSAIDFLKMGNLAFRLFSKREDTETNKGGDLLKKVGFLPTDFDSMILDYLVTGIVDDEAATALLERENLSLSREQLRRTQRDIYRTVNANFSGDVNAFMIKLRTLLDNHLNELAWNDVALAVNYLKDFGFKENPTKWSDAFILHHAPKLSLEECARFLSVASSREAIDAIEARKSAILNARHPREIIYTIVEKQGWNSEDLAALNQYNVQFFVRWLREERDEHLLRMLSEFVKVFNPGASELEWRQIGEKVFSAFRQIANGDNFIRHKLENIVGVSLKSLNEQTPAINDATTGQATESS